MTWAIIDTDNFGGDYPDERFIAFGVGCEKHAVVACEALNKEFNPGDGALRWYRVVEEPYRLVPGFEP